MYNLPFKLHFTHHFTSLPLQLLYILNNHTCIFTTGIIYTQRFHYHTYLKHGYIWNHLDGNVNILHIILIENKSKLFYLFCFLLEAHRQYKVNNKMITSLNHWINTFSSVAIKKKRKKKEGKNMSALHPMKCFCCLNKVEINDEVLNYLFILKNCGPAELFLIHTTHLLILLRCWPALSVSENGALNWSSFSMIDIQKL